MCRKLSKLLEDNITFSSMCVCMYVYMSIRDVLLFKGDLAM